MKRLLVSIAILFTAFAAPASSAIAASNADDVKVELQMPHQSLLPGVPFDLTVIYRNQTDRRIAVGVLAAVVIKAKNGEPFRFERHARINDFGNGTLVELAPGATLYGSMGWDEDFLQMDAAFTIPGSYDVWLELGGDASEVEDASSYVGEVRTTTAHFSRIEPKGEDAEVWARMEEAANGHWPSHGLYSRASHEDIGAEVIAKHPNSAYYPYALTVRPNGRYELLADAMGRFHESPAYSHLAVEAAHSALYNADNGVNRSDSPTSIERYFQLAQEYADDALQSDVVAVKQRAKTIREMARAHASDYHRTHVVVK